MKNYTSKVPASKSLSMIEEELVSVGANRIVKEYGADKKIASVAFVYNLNGTDVPFMLPANTDRTYQKLIEGKKNPSATQKKQIRGQAERTAWKNVYDWVRAQVVLIELAQVEFMQVFLPFAYDYENRQTFFDRMKDQNFKLLN